MYDKKLYKKKSNFRYISIYIHKLGFFSDLPATFYYIFDKKNFLKLF
jgi:hypothetical protein